jgi:hypothetical protein
MGEDRVEKTDRRGFLGLGALLMAGGAQAAALPDPGEVPGVEFAFAAKVLLEPTREIGATPYGIRRRVPIVGGSFEGPRIRGAVLPGGADWQLQRSDDITVIEADYMIRADDGAEIHVYNRGLSNSRLKGAPRRYLRTVPQFEAPTGPHDWLNQSIFLGTITPLKQAQPAVLIRVFRVV